MRRLLLLLLLLTAGCGAATTGPTAAASTGAARPAAAPTDRVRYVVVPHPDDEFSAWSLLARDTGHYDVFILLTHGEAGGACDGAGLQGDAGERVPQPQPFAGRRTATCSAERVDSWHAFLDGMAQSDGHLDVPRHVGTLHGYDLYVGRHTARLVFDYGDGRLTPAEVVAAIAAARAERPAYGVQAEDDVIGAAYYNGSDPNFYRYQHTDQRAVQQALWSTDLGTPGPQLARTWPADPRRSLTRQVPADIYQAAMAVTPGPPAPRTNPTARRVGVLQRVYGWLAFTGSYWPAEAQPRSFFFSSSQDFWSRH
jgi:hypothetical protein